MTGLTPNPTQPPVAADAPPAHRTVITPPGRWEWVNVREVWQFRELMFFLVWRDVKVRYKQTVLGAAWAVLQPAMMMVVFTVFFGRLAGMGTGGLAPPLFFLTGVLPWSFFAAAVAAAAGSVLGSERLITKVYFPRLIVPAAAVCATGVDFLIACGLLAVFLVVYGVAPTWGLLALPVVAGVVAVLATGLGTLFAALNVSYRDFRYVLPFALQLGMFATPTVYCRPTGNEGELFKWVLALNPMTGLVEAFRAAAVGDPIPWAAVGAGAAIAAAALAAGCLYFRRVEDRFADII